MWSHALILHLTANSLTDFERKKFENKINIKDRNESFQI